MKTTHYFNYTRKRPDQSQIKDEWISYVMENPEKVVIQSDGRIRKWAKIFGSSTFPVDLILVYIKSTGNVEEPYLSVLAPYLSCLTF